MFVILFAIFSHVFSMTVIDTHYNKSYIITYDVPGSYILNPKDYKYAPTLFIVMYGAGGGADLPFYDHKYGTCTGQNGAYMTLLLDTKSGQKQFQLTVGKGGIGGKTNMTDCGPKFGTTIPPMNGGDTFITSTDKKFCATCKGGIRSNTVGVSSHNNVIISCRGGFNTRYEVGGYTNITYMQGVTLLERQNGENSYFGVYFNYNISDMDPGYGGRGISLTNQHFSSCNADYQILNGGNGNHGMIKIIPVKIPM